MARLGQRDLPVIGWREWIALPDLDLVRLKVKVDTGARSSSLHAFDLQRFERDGRRMVSFTVQSGLRAVRKIRSEAEIVDERRVRNPSGYEEFRPVILTEVEFMGERWPVEVTLTRRDTMRFRMLIGRQAVAGRYVVDPALSFVGGRIRTGARREDGHSQV